MKLLEHFTKLTIHPKNAQELKGLILQLAIQGKLTANWRLRHPELVSGSHHARELIKRVQKERAQLIKEKKLRKEKPLSVITEAEKPFDLPDGWEAVRLGEIGDWGAGATPLRSNPLFYDGKINWFKSGELNNGIIDYESKEKITVLALESTSLRLNNKGDVLIAMYGATIGKTGILKVEGTTNQAVCACTPFSCISSYYLHLLLRGLKDVFINQGEGGAQPNISRVKIRNQIFLLPPLAEQQEIVRVVETLFTEVTQLEQLTAQRIAFKESYVASALHTLTTTATQKAWFAIQPEFQQFFTEVSTVQKLRETILQLAVQGKLTATWRTAQAQSGAEVQPASELLTQIKAEKAKLIAEKKIKKEKPLPPITEDEIPYELPEGWVWCRLGEIIYLKSGQDLKPSEYSDSKNFGLPYVTGASNLQNEEVIINRWTNKPRSIAFKGDLLFTCKGSGVGKMGWLDIESAHIARQIMAIRTIHSPVNYVKVLMDVNSKKYNQNATGLIPGVDRITVRRTIIPLPPLAEQRAIVTKVKALMDLCDQLETQIQQHTTHSEQLMQAVLREVFEGTQVPV